MLILHQKAQVSSSEGSVGSMYENIFAAEIHRVNQNILLYDRHNFLPAISDPIKDVQWKRKINARFPHIVNTLQCKRVDNLSSTIFLK